MTVRGGENGGRGGYGLNKNNSTGREPFFPCSAHMGTYMAHDPCMKSLWGTSTLHPGIKQSTLLFVHGGHFHTVSLCTDTVHLITSQHSIYNSCTSHSTDLAA